MISLKVFMFSTLFYWLELDGGLTSAKTIGESVKVEFVEEKRKITVEGWRNVSWTGDEYYSFRGIPFAEPPIGERRFKDPQALKELPSYIDARYEGHDCAAITATNGSEDCLKLNIYTPTITETTYLPVVFFLHPGALYVGSGLSSFVGADYMLSKPVVLVTCNYRLGTFGFLQLGTREIPGNAGFKDQVLALRWVKKYIAHFGGNPEDITMMGYSAGGMSVQLHLVSPMSQGLFQKAIVMSGSLAPQAVVPQYAQLEFLRKQARALNCPEAVNEAQILQCVQAASTFDISMTLLSLFTFPTNNPMYLHKAVVERDFGQERFLIEDPFESFKRGAFEKVPLLVGFTNGEFCSSAAVIIQDSTLERRFYQEFEELAPVMFFYDDFKGDLSAINKELKDYYLPNFTGVTENNVYRLCDLFSDSILRFGAQRLAELTAPHMPVFPYRFDFRGNVSALTYPLRPARVEHMDDYAYLFGHLLLTDSTSRSMVRLYTKFIYDFVKEGSKLTGQLPTYPNGYTRVYRTLEPHAGTALHGDTYDLWTKLFW